MKFNIITLFPEAFASFFETGLLGKAIDAGHIEINLVQLRDFSEDKHRQVDDYPYGGGAGMVLKVEPLHRALQALDPGSLKILLSPRGVRLKQRHLINWNKAMNEAEYTALTLVCGHYEGFDERVLHYIDLSISLGDFVLTGGEVAAMAIIEGVGRLQAGFMSNRASLEQESFNTEGSIEYAQYTRPAQYEGLGVPPVLLSGDHKKIADWRQQEALQKQADLKKQAEFGSE